MACIFSNATYAANVGSLHLEAAIDAGIRLD
jgi:hypothetical protein